MFSWEAIPTFGSLRERDCFLAWMQDQIADGVAILESRAHLLERAAVPEVHSPGLLPG
jgi:hypothetical protein